MNATGRLLFPLNILFFICFIIIYFFTPWLSKYNIDRTVLLCSNIIFYLISLLSFAIQRKGLYDKNPHVFVRSVMAGMMLKMVLCIIAVIAYVYLSGPNFNKRAVFISLFLYLIYLATEVFVVMKMNKNKKADG